MDDNEEKIVNNINRTAFMLRKLIRSIVPINNKPKRSNIFTSFATIPGTAPVTYACPPKLNSYLSSYFLVISCNAFESCTYTLSIFSGIIIIFA